MSRNAGALIAAALIVVAIAAIAFWNLGTPGHERQVHQDLRTVQALQTLAVSINSSWSNNKGVLPVSLAQFPVGATHDPITNAPFIYHPPLDPKADSEYELCAKFLTDNRHDQPNETPFWCHPKGIYCFTLDASRDVPPPPVSSIY